MQPSNLLIGFALVIAGMLLYRRLFKTISGIRGVQSKRQRKAKCKALPFQREKRKGFNLMKHFQPPRKPRLTTRAFCTGPIELRFQMRSWITLDRLG